jgi:hypothetical protein
MAGYRLTDGYVGFEPRRALTYTTDAELRAAGVAWTWDDARAGGSFRPVASPLPRALLVARAVVSDLPAALGEVDLRTTAVVAAPVPLDPGPAGSVSVEHDRPGRFKTTIEAPGRRLLVWNEAFHPGWVATIDGRAAPVLRANLDFQGVAVPAGRHRVALRFQPRSFRAGAIVSAVSLILLGLAPFVLRRRPFAPAPPAP